MDDSILPINPTSLREVGFTWEPEDPTDLLSKDRYPTEMLAELRELVSPAPEESVRSLVARVEDVGHLPVYGALAEGSGFIVDGVAMRATGD